MNVDRIDRVFGRARLKMVTGAQVEVFREAAAPGESRRYTKRFLATPDGDYGEWTEREWRILARLIGHGARCVPDVVQFDRDAHGPMLVQTYDAGATVDQWATLLPVERDGVVRANVFADCAHWWALAHHCVRAFAEIHALGLVHLDVKGDNVCIPVGPDGFDPRAAGARLFPVFERLALIDFAFSLASGETLASPLPIGWQREYDYQSPRLLEALEAGRRGDLAPTERLDWRCDFYSLAAMLKRYLPDDHRLHDPALACGWTFERYDAAKQLLRAIRDTHDAALPAQLPHDSLLATMRATLAAPDLAHSLSFGWRLATESITAQAAVPATPVTPLTRIAPSIRVFVPPRDEPTLPTVMVTAPANPSPRGKPPRRPRWTVPLLVGGAALFAFAMAQLLSGLPQAIGEEAQDSVTAQADPSVPRLPPAPVPSAARSIADAPAAAAATPVDTAPAPAAAMPAPAAAMPAPAAAMPATKEAATAGQKAPAVRPAGAPRRTTGAPVKESRTARAREPAKATGLAKRAAVDKPVPVRNATVATPSAPRAAPPARTPPAKETTRLAAVAPSAAAPAPPSKAEPLSPAPAPKVDAPMAPPATAASATLADASPAPPPAPAPAAPAPADAQPAPAGRPAAPIVDYSRQREPAPAFREIPPAVARAPAIAGPPRESPAPIAPERVREDYRDRGERALANLVPKSAAQARIAIAQVLRVAGDAHHPSGERAVVALARLPRFDAEAFAPEARDTVEARRLHAEARRAYGPRRDVARALDLELRAFGADPFDPEIAGQLALLHLRATPVQADRARLLALHALSLRSPHSPAERADDWVTFAVASALTSRPIDATLALYTAVAMSGSAERVCNAAVGALMIHGEPLREPVAALLARLRAQGRDDAGRGCTAPPQRYVEWRPWS